MTRHHYLLSNSMTSTLARITSHQPYHLPLLLCRRYLRNSVSKNKDNDNSVDMKSFCRRRRERTDSVTIQIINQRLAFYQRITTRTEVVSKEDMLKLIREGFGSKRKLPTMYSAVYASNGNRITNTAAGGFATFVAAASNNWPIFKHMLPEIAFAGHSNCGKSTLVNAMIGSSTNKGTASVSDRAGWTDQICFYQIGKKPPVMTIADLPGYGHAVASDYDRKEWVEMTRDYLCGDRLVLCRCCVLVDCSRGLCEDDLKMIRYLAKVGTAWQIILTKADLLSVEELLNAISAVKEDLKEFTGGVNPLVVPVSASTGAGVQSLWRELSKCSDSASLPALPGAVREHIKAAAMKRIAITANKKDNKVKPKKIQ